MGRLSASGPGAMMRDHAIRERPSTPLELLFDLCFVVAVAALAGELHHGLGAGHAVEASLAYGLIFVPIWWAWMSYTWFATAFSHDDTVTRLLTFAQMGGILAVSAAVPSAFEGHVVPFALTYSVMRVPLIVQWLRSAAADSAHRGFALTYAAGSTLAQVLWVAGALVGGRVGAGVLVGALGVELATPMLAVRRSPDRVFHPRHIAERYGLFTLIVLGESILAVTSGLLPVVEGRAPVVGGIVIVGCALVVAAAVWWAYFGTLGTDALERHRRAAFLWGYGHYVVFAAVAAIGAGIRAVIDSLTLSTHPAPAGTVVTAAAAALAMLALGGLARTADAGIGTTPPFVSAAVLAATALAAPALGPFIALPVTALTLVAVAVTTGRVNRPHRDRSD